MMNSIKQPKEINFGENAIKEYNFPKNSLIITSKGSKKRGFLELLNINDYLLFDQVENNPSLNSVNQIISKFQNTNFSTVIGLGGGSSLDVAKFVAFKLNKKKIMVPTTFGSGSEVTRISVLKVDGKKKSFHDDKIFADIAIIDPIFIKNSPKEIINNSFIDACAQCTEAFDSKIGNNYTKMLCETAFNKLENGMLNGNNNDIVLGSLISGLGFGNCSTTLGHALSYVYSNEGISHGHALAYTTTIAHKFNKSKFHKRYYNLVKKLEFPKIGLKQTYEDAADIIITDRKHLDNNPINVTKNNIIDLLSQIDNDLMF